MTKALLVIDIQNDYFPGGQFPLWNADSVLHQIINAIERAQAANVPVILIQHLADSSASPAPFFNPGTSGADLHPQLRTAAPNAPIIVKHFADSFERTNLDNCLAEYGVTELLICGMMTQNCVTHTAISRSAERYKVGVLVDCCTTVSETLHLIALHALSTRINLLPSTAAI